MLLLPVGVTLFVPVEVVVGRKVRELEFDEKGVDSSVNVLFVVTM